MRDYTITIHEKGDHTVIYNGVEALKIIGGIMRVTGTEVSGEHYAFNVSIENMKTMTIVKEDTNV